VLFIVVGLGLGLDLVSGCSHVHVLFSIVIVTLPYHVPLCYDNIGPHVSTDLKLYDVREDADDIERHRHGV